MELNEYPRNPFIVFLFAVIGASVRFIFWNFIFLIIGEKRKSFLYFTNGFKQMTTSLMLTVLLFFISLILFIYKLGIVP